MKKLNIALAAALVLGLSALSSADAPKQPEIVAYGTTVAQPLTGQPAAIAQTSSTPTTPPILTFAPGSSYSIAYVGQFKPRSQAAACVGTPLGTLALDSHWSLFSDLLGGFALNNGALTAGYAVGIEYQTTFIKGADQFKIFGKAGGAQLFGAGVSPVPGWEVSGGVIIATK